MSAFGTALDVTLTGRTGTGIEVTGNFEAGTRVTYVAGTLVTAGLTAQIPMTYGVGTTGDPHLTDAEWILRDQIEVPAIRQLFGN